MIVNPDNELLGYLVYGWKELKKQYDFLHEEFNNSKTNEEKKEAITKVTPIVEVCNKLNHDIVHYVQLCKELNKIFVNKEEDKKKDKIEEISKFEEYLAKTYGCKKYQNIKDRNFDKKEEVKDKDKGKSPSSDDKSPTSPSSSTETSKKPEASKPEASKPQDEKSNSLKKGTKYRVKNIVSGIYDGIMALGGSAVAASMGVGALGSVTALVTELAASTSLAMVIGSSLYLLPAALCVAIGGAALSVAIQKFRSLKTKFGKKKGSTVVSKKQTLKK